MNTPRNPKTQQNPAKKDSARQDEKEKRSSEKAPGGGMKGEGLPDSRSGSMRDEA